MSISSESNENEVRFWLASTSKHHPMKAKNLSLYSGVCERDLRKIIAGFREKGILVVGNSTGYYMAKDWDEYEHSVRPQMQNCFTYLKQFNALKKQYTGKSELQVELELNIYENKEKGDIVETKHFQYQKESNGEISDKRVFIIHEDDVRIEGIDRNMLSAEQEKELDGAVAKINELKKGKYKRYNKRSIIK